MAAESTVARRRRRLGRVAAVVTGALVLIVLGLAALSQTAAFRDWLRRQVLTRLNANLVGRVDVRTLGGNLFGRLVVTDVRLVHADARVLAIRRVAATYDLLTLLRGGGLRITSLDADGVALQLVEDEHGWNVEHLTSTPQDEDATLTVDLHDLRVRNAAVRIVRPGRSWRVRGLEVAGAARFAPNDVDVTIDRLTFEEAGSGIRIEEMAGRLRRDGETAWTVEGLRLRTADSELAGEGTFGAEVAASARVAPLAARDLRALLGPDAPTSDWRGELTARGPRTAVVVGADVQATASRDAGPASSVGRLRLDGTLDLHATPAGEVRASFEDVDLAGVRSQLPASDLTGELELGAPQGIAGPIRFRLALDAPRVGTAAVASLAATGHVRGDDVDFEITATDAAGKAHVAGEVGRTTERFDVRVTATDLDPGALAGRPALAGTVNGTLTAQGQGFVLATTTAAASLAIAPSRVGGVAIASGAATARAGGGRLVVESATASTNVGTAEVSGDLGLAAEATRSGGMRGVVRASDLRPLATLAGRPDLHGAATVTVNASGHVAALDATAELSARGVGGAGWRAATLAATLTGRGLGSTHAAAELHGSARDVALGDRRLTDAALDGSWQGQLAAGRGSFELRARETSGQHRLAADVTRAPEVTRMTITQLRVDHRGDSWTASGTPVVALRGERVTIDALALRSARGALSVQGSVGGGESDLDAIVDGLDLEALAGLVPDEVRGRLVGRAHLGGTLAAARLEADAALAAPTLGGTQYDDLRVRLVAGGGRAELHARLAEGRQTLLVDGTAAAQLSLSPWRIAITDPQARMQADGVDVGFVAALWPGLVTKAGGRVDGDVTVTGTVAAPEARGTIALTGGRAYVVPLGLTYEAVELALVLQGRTASVDRFTIQSGKGSITGGGNARLGSDGAMIDARFEAQSFPVFSNQYGRGAVSGWLWVSGTAAAPVLEGSLETDGLVIQIPEVLPTSARAPDPTIVVVGPGAPPAPPPEAERTAPPPVPRIFDRAAITVQIAVPRDAWVRRSDANVELQGWMTLWKKPSEELHLAGDIRGVRGWYAFQGKKFTLVEGSSVRFSGQGLDPVLDITATHTAGDYLVRLKVGGTVTKPALTLQSEPALEQADVLAVLLFGSPAGELSRSQSAGLREQALGIAGAYVASELRQSVAKALGVDDLQFDTGKAGLQDAQVSIGKYIADDIFVSLSHRFGQSVEEVRVEWVIFPEWSLETSTDTLGRSGVDLFWKRRY